MPLKGVNGRLYKWCAVCKDTLPDRIHLNRSHAMELLPGCPDCAYFRSRWADVKKHSQRHHGKDIDHLHEDLGIFWGLTRLDKRKGKPTYSDVSQDDICVYLKNGEAFTRNQICVLRRAKFLGPPGCQDAIPEGRRRAAAASSWEAAHRSGHQSPRE